MKKSKSSTNPKHYHTQFDWLPFDSRLIPDIFRFGSVRGVSRVFLVIEMLLATVVVCCTLVLVIIECFGK